jgi:hypothetical protein
MGQKQKHIRHGMSKCPEYNIWSAMLTRCYNPNHPAFQNYGGRGITVYSRWRESFPEFFSYIGKRPKSGLVLDRIDNDGNYEPGNVRWTTRSISNFNRRAVLVFEHGGDKLSASIAAQQHGLSVHRLYARLRAGWSLDTALHTPVREYNLHG